MQSTTSLVRLPDDVLWNTFLHSDYTDIHHICQANKELRRRLCDSAEFWTRKFIAENNGISPQTRKLFQNGDPSEVYLEASYKQWLQNMNLDENDYNRILEELVRYLTHIHNEKGYKRALLLLHYFLRQHPDEYDRLFDIAANENLDTLQRIIGLFLKDPHDLLIALESGIFHLDDDDIRDYIYHQIINYIGDNPVTQTELQKFLIDALRFSLEQYDLPNNTLWIYNRLRENGLTRNMIKNKLPFKVRGTFNDIIPLDD